jgi:hypothetical protein
MAAKPSVKKFMGRAGGAVHVITTKREDMKMSKCPQVKKGHEDGIWKGKGLSPEAAAELKGCVRCDTIAVAKAEARARMTPAQKRAEAKGRAQETRDNMGKQTKPKKVKAEKGEPKRRGPKGGDATAKMKANVEEHLALAKKHGWAGKAWESGTSEWTCEVSKGGETLKLIYRDGRTVWSRVVLASGVEVRLRNSSNWRKHAAGESGVKSDYQPRTGGGGKKAARKEEITNDQKAVARLPFDPVEDDDDTIIESLVGKRITWRNSVSLTLDSAIVPMRSRNIRITQHPKTARRILSFHESQGFSKGNDGETHEALGGERSVYLDKVLKVRG